MKRAGLAAILSSSFIGICTADPASVEPQLHSLTTNLLYRLSWGDLGEVVPAPFQSFRGLRIQQGGDALLRNCLEHPQKWSKDPLLYRFGHHGPLSTIGCRERTSPSMHMVFYRRPDGSREAWVHFDLYGPQNSFGHTTEVLRNRSIFGRTSQYNVYRGLVENSNRADLAAPPRAYDYGTQSREYFKSTFGPGAVASAMFAASASTTIFHSNNWGYGIDRYTNHFAGFLARHTIQQSIEFGTGALLQQDESFTRSQDQQIGRRIKSALYRSFFVPGHTSNELAVPRIAAAVGTGWLVRDWHPWRRREVDPWVETGRILSSYVLRSFWHEFEPDIKNGLRKGKRILRRDQPALPQPPADTQTSPASTPLP